jgi:mono/diheme cytochrome c family protein
MARTIVNTLLFLLVVALLSLNWLLTVNPSRRNVEVLANMVHAPRYTSFSSNPNFADGKTLREPVPGTVIRGLPPLHYAATPADAQRAGLELFNPVSAKQPSALARGSAIFTTYCEVCHGPAGKGDGTVAQRGYPAPPSLLAPKALALQDGQIFHIITFGQANMPSYASQIDREDRWKVVLYVRTLQGRKQ